MVKLLVSSPGSGQGKTVLACALLWALERRGLRPCAFKCGPDYIDPQFHRAVPGVESRNLDLFLTDGDRVRGGLPGECGDDSRGCRKSGTLSGGSYASGGSVRGDSPGGDSVRGDSPGTECDASRLPALFRAWSAGHGAAVCEGAMGLYDGLGGISDRTSAWDIARTLDLPVLLSIRAEGAALTLAALLRGLRTFRPGVRFAGTVLNRCSPSLCRAIAPTLEREAGIPVLGCLPPMDEAAFPARHLGLVTAREVAGLQTRLRALGEALEAHTDLDRLLSLCGGGTPNVPGTEAVSRSVRGSTHQTESISCPGTVSGSARTVPAVIHAAPGTRRNPVRIAVARDRAFCFLYPETLEALAERGAEFSFFSPLRDSALPSGTAGLYLPGGYPELYGPELSANAAMRRAVAEAVRDGLPTVAEGGGFLYLSAGLRDASGVRYPMAGVLPGEGVPAGGLVRFGYAFACPDTDSLLFRRGERIPVHAFHHWDGTSNGTGFRLEKPFPSRRAWQEGYGTETLYAGFPQLYFAGSPQLAARFTAAAARYADKALRGGGASALRGDANKNVKLPNTF